MFRANNKFSWVSRTGITKPDSKSHLNTKNTDLGQTKWPLHNFDKAKKYALIVEGGGMRTMFSAGVLDSFHIQKFDPFQIYLGVSAGGMNLISHISGQTFRNYQIIMFCAKSGEFINGWKYLRGGHFLDFDWFSNECLKHFPLDVNAAFNKIRLHAKEFIVVSTNVKTGKPNYHKPDEANLQNILLGSCCIPLLYRNPVFISNKQVFDGGISDPLPVKKAYQHGATDIIVIRSRSKNYRETENSFDKRLGGYLFSEHPAFKDSILNQHKAYNDSIDFIENPPEGINIFQVASNEPLNTSLTTTNMRLLEMDYQLGRMLGKAFVTNWTNQLAR